MSGETHMTVRKQRRRRWLKSLGVGAAGVLAVAVALLFCALDRAFPFPQQRLIEAQSGGSAFILDRNGGLIAWSVDTADAWRLPVPVKDVSPWLVRATVAAEDKRFWQHGGVDPLAVVRATEQNLFSGRRVSGASTITMQCVRLLWPRPRTLATKCVEMFRAVQLERIATKDEVLGLYLNVAPYGGNVIGAEAAARRYFGKSAADLSLGEAALLAGIPQSPARFNPHKHLEQALRRREFVLSRMQELGLASDADLASARAERIAILKPAGHSGSGCAPGFADYVLSLRNSRSGTVRTTLDPEVQAAALDAVARHAADLGRTGIDGIAAVVIDVDRSELAAMVGSAEPSDPQTGCVNGATARRQPGSLLKPFLYAAAFDSGALTPRSVVYDVPAAWHGYRPENMDRDFLGAIPAAAALARSRNIPAVRLLEDLRPERLARDLNRMGLAIQGPPEQYGLSLALGTAEVRLADIANAYATLARLSEHRALRVFDEQAGAQPARIYSPGAAYLTLRSLDTRDAPAARSGPGLVWKTGTSWNYRDAWAVAVTPRYVVGVWCGRISGRQHPGLIGLRAALPLALEITGRITTGPGRTWDRPERVAERQVCALSGAPACSACADTVAAEYLPGVSSDAPCTLHRFAGSGSARHVTVQWPGRVAAWLASRETAPNQDRGTAILAVDRGTAILAVNPDTGGTPVPPAAASPSNEPPVLSVGVRAETPGEQAARPAVEISSPVNGGEYVLPPPTPDSNLRLGVLDLTARTSSGASELYWFLDGELLAKAPAGDCVRWPMTPGRHELIVCDAAGASARAQFSVIPAGSTLAATRPAR